MFLLRLFADEDEGGTLIFLSGGVVADNLAQLLVREGDGVALAENVAGDVVGVHAHGVFWDADAVVTVDGDHLGIEAVPVEIAAHI